MAGSVNRVILVGNVGGDPEIHQTRDGRTIARFSLATSEVWTDRHGGERRDKTEWHRMVVFSEGLCKVIGQYVNKGSKLYVEGQLQTRKWQDQSGQDRYTTEVVLKGFDGRLVLLGDSNREREEGSEGKSDRNAYRDAKEGRWSPDRPSDDVCVDEAPF